MYLIKNDYKKQIQDVNLQQIISDDDTILNSAQLAAQAEAISYLAQKYDTDKEFTDTTKWSYTAAYSAADRVYIDADAYNASSTYALNALALYSGNVYRCTTAIVTPEAWNAAKWTLIDAQYTIYYAKYPKTLFNFYRAYAIDDEVYYYDRVYTALKATMELPHDVALQYRTKYNLPNGNVFPDDTVLGSQFWEPAGSAYTVAAGTLPSNTTYWTKGDNRNQQMLMYLIDITLFHVHTRLTPRNIPQIRFDRYTNAIQWLQMAGKGDITAAIQKIEPKAGGRVRYGGNIKNINSY